MRFLGYLILFAVLVFGIWPYYIVFRLDDALGLEDTTKLASLTDIDAVRANWRARTDAGVDAVVPAGDPEGVMAYIRQNIERLGNAAVEQAITVPWVRDTLRDAASRATNQSPAYLLSAIDYAFFESFDRFVIRIGELGRGATHVRLGLEGTEWKITDVIP
jgi:hypothetical protein